jgi:dTDP-4-amino-4,6-dideoxygalactose transaminase
MNIQWVPKKTIDTECVNRFLTDSIESNTFTNYGPNVKRLELELRTLLKIEDTKACICVANGTVALWALVAAIELHENRKLKLATQSFTFPSSAQGYLEDVEIIDIDTEGGIDLEKVSKDYDGIIVTNVFGRIVNLEKYESWAKENKKYLFFDNAATSYTFFDSRNSCNFGTGSIVSLHHTKPIGFGEGGLILINKEYESCLRRIINFGIDNLSPQRKWHRYGSNYKMSDIQAVYILQYLRNFHSIVEKHKELYSYFLEKSKDISICHYPSISSNDNTFVSCICFFSERSEICIQYLLENGIFARKYYYPLEDTPIASNYFKHIVCVSFHIDLETKDIDRIIEIIRKVHL